MNVLSQSVKENRITFAYLADFFIADKASSVLLLLFTLGLSFLNPGSTTPFLPLFSAVALFLCWNFKMKGWAGTFAGCALLFLFSMPETNLLWQTCLHLSLMLSLLISCLAAKEQERVDSETKALLNESHTTWQAKLASAQSLVHQQEEEKALLEEEVKQWKEEAEQRRIEKQMEEKKVSLLQGDLDLYLEQKAALIAESLEARTQLREGEERWSLFEKEKESLCRERQVAVDEKKALETVVIKVEEEKESLRKVHLAEAEEKKALEIVVKGVVREKESLQQEYQAALATVKNLEEEKASLRQELERAIEAQKNAMEQVKPADPEEMLALQRTIAAVTGQYNQLKAQFEEKSRVLSQTRKELFEAEGKIMITQREEQASTIESDLSEVEGLQKDLRKAELEKERLEEQVIQLEELISRILVP